MSRLSILRAAAIAAPLVLTSACTSFASNVNGSFACRAPDGTCAPTSAIDAGATGIDRADANETHRPLPRTGEAVRRLQVVIAARRDEAGRDHEARVVHLTLPEPTGNNWRAPQGRRDILRSLGTTIAGTREGKPAPRDNQNEELPEQLFIPLQPSPAMPGADAPEPGGPGSFSPPREPVPNPDTNEGESQ